MDANQKTTCMNIVNGPLTKILHSLLNQNDPNHKYDLFDPIQFYNIIEGILPADATIDEKLFDNPTNQEQYTTPQDQAIGFIKLWKIIIQLSKQLKISVQNLEMPTQRYLLSMIQNKQIQKLDIFIDILFQIMLRNQKVLICITGMDESDQIKIKQYIQEKQQNMIENAKLTDSLNLNIKNQLDYYSSLSSPRIFSSNSFKQRDELVQKLQLLEAALLAKEQAVQRQSQKCLEVNESLQQYTQLLDSRNEEIRNLKARISAYSEVDALFQEKDQEIVKLQTQLTETQTKSHLVINQLRNELQSYKTKQREIEKQKNQLVSVSDKNVNKYQSLLQQKQEGDLVNKKVIHNLKQKIKNLNQKITQQHQNTMELLHQKQNRDKQLYQMEKKVPTFNQLQKNQISSDEILYRSGKKSSKLDDQLGEFFDLKNQSQSFKKYFDVLFGEERCSGELCIALRSQFVKIVHSLLKINQDLQSIDYFSTTNRSQCIENQLHKLQNMSQQSKKLKQKIVLLNQSSQPNKQSIEEINKLKKKLLILKRKLDETETQRKQQIELLISAFQQSMRIDGKN